MTRDILHNAVRLAIEKDDWKITHDPLYLRIDGVELRIDLGAERVLAAEKRGQKIAVEIKSFVGESEVNDFHLAVGQTLNYRSGLRKKQPDRVLYLAVALDVYREFFSIPFIQEIVAEHQIKMVIVDLLNMEVVLWKE